MDTGLSCPRCLESLELPQRPGDPWQCAAHGEVAPLHPTLLASHYAVRTAAVQAEVPLWMPWPLPTGWAMTGLRLAGQTHQGAKAAVVGLSGRDPLAELSDLSELGFDTADVLLVSEQPGVGLGAALAGIPTVDPGQLLFEASEYKAPDVKLRAQGHDVPLWSIPAANGCAAYVGEAAGIWLWILCWPEQAAAVLMENFELVDLRDPGIFLDVPFGEPTVRIGQPPTLE